MAMKVGAVLAFSSTNIFVYQLDAGDGRKRAIAVGIVSDALRMQDACISYKVVQERMFLMTTETKRPLSLEQASAYLVGPAKGLRPA